MKVKTWKQRGPGKQKGLWKSKTVAGNNKNVIGTLEAYKNKADAESAMVKGAVAILRAFNPVKLFELLGK